MKLDYLIPIGVALLSILAGVVVQKLVLHQLQNAARKTDSRYDDILFRALRGPLFLWIVILGFHLTLSILPLSSQITSLLSRLLTVTIIFSVSWVLARIAEGVVEELSRRTEGAIPQTSIFRIMAKIAILSVGFLVILQTLGVSITPILTALGVGGLAVALALQDTLSNLFAGIQVLAARKIRVGDFIRLESGEEGYVTDTTWRSTTIRMLPNNIVVIPNAKLASATVTNYCLPDKDLAVLVQVGVSYDSDLTKVEQVTVEVAGHIMKTVPGGVQEFKPFIRYHTFADFSINFTVIMRAREFVDQYLIKHEFVKALHARYLKERIEIPFPIRTLYMKNQQA